MESSVGYFTLDEESDVEEYVADDPNFQKKAFWYYLIEKTISSNSRTNLLCHTLRSAFGLFLQWKLFIIFISQGNWEYIGWTICIAAMVGAANLLLAFSRRNKDADNNAIQQRRYTLRIKYLVLILRQVCSFFLVVPIYNLFYYWRETSKNEKDLRRPLVMRSQPQPTIQEIIAVQKVWEGALEKSYVQLIESFLKFIPFALVQICILVHHIQNTSEPEHVPRQEMIAYIILWSLLEISWTSTSYANAQFNYTKALQFQDLREVGVPMHFIQVSRVNSAFYLLNNLFSAAFRLYCISLLFATVNYWVILFIIILYTSFYLIVQSMPKRSRHRFENPPKGLSSKTSDLINRWINIFTSTNIKQECFIHLTYIFIILYFIPRIWFIASEWSVLSQEEPEYDTEELNNYTRMELVHDCESENMSVPIPILDPIVLFLIDVTVYITKSCSIQRKILQDDLAVLILLGIHISFSLFYLVKAKTRILNETEFPAQIANKYWTQWMCKEWDFNDIFELKKILLCMVMSDNDLSELANKSSWCTCWPFKNVPTKREALLSILWEKYVTETNILEVNQERLKLMLERRKKLRNTTKCDEALNRFLEFLWDNFVLEEDTVRMILFAIENFDEFIKNSNSLRITHIQVVLNFKESIWK